MHLTKKSGERGASLLAGVFLMAMVGILTLTYDSFNSLPTKVAASRGAMVAVVGFPTAPASPPEAAPGTTKPEGSDESKCTADSPSGQKEADGKTIKKVGKMCKPSATGTDSTNDSAKANCEAKDGIAAGKCFVRFCSTTDPTDCKFTSASLPPTNAQIANLSEQYVATKYLYGFSDNAVTSQCGSACTDPAVIGGSNLQPIPTTPTPPSTGEVDVSSVPATPPSDDLIPPTQTKIEDVAAGGLEKLRTDATGMGGTLSSAGALSGGDVASPELFKSGPSVAPTTFAPPESGTQGYSTFPQAQVFDQNGFPENASMPQNVNVTTPDTTVAATVNAQNGGWTSPTTGETPAPPQQQSGLSGCFNEACVRGNSGDWTKADPYSQMVKEQLDKSEKTLQNVSSLYPRNDSPDIGGGGGGGGGGSGGGSGSGGGGLSNMLGSLLSGLAKGLSSGASSGAKQASYACSTDQAAYAQQQQQYQTALQQYNYQLQLYNQQQQINAYTGNSTNLIPPTQPVPCTPSTSTQCNNQPQQPAASTCSGGTWQPIYSGSCIIRWQCSAGGAQLSCEPQTADVGMSIAITYSCAQGTATGSGFSASGTSGTSTATVATPPEGTNTATYSLSCSDGTYTSGAQCTVQVAKPGIIFVANPGTIPSGETSLLGWVTTGMKSCTVSSPTDATFTSQNSSNTSPNGTATTLASTEDKRYELHCETHAGGTKNAGVTVHVQ